jgi:hypothetical protein
LQPPPPATGRWQYHLQPPSSGNKQPSVLRASSLTQTTLPRSSPGLSDKPCHVPPRKSSCLPSITARGLSREPKDTYKLSNLGDLVRCALARPDGRDLEDHHHDGAVLWRISDRGRTARTAAITSFAVVISGATYLIHAEPQALYKVLHTFKSCSGQTRRPGGQANEGRFQTRSRAACARGRDLRYR